MTAIALPPRITMANARATLAQVSAQLAASQAPWLDASGVQTLDTAALAVLLECQRQAVSRHGQALRIVGASPQLLALARLYGIDSVLTLD
jgi:phospholipid transport system transporter-binding protein